LEAKNGEERQIKVPRALPVGIYYSFEPLDFAFLMGWGFEEQLVLLERLYFSEIRRILRLGVK